MNKHLIVSGMVVLLICVGLSGCTDNPFDNSSKFVGTWISEGDDKIIFFSDGTIPNFLFMMTGNWEVKDGKLSVSITTDVTIEFIYDYTFSNNDNTLTLTLIEPQDIGFSSEPTTYTKQ